MQVKACSLRQDHHKNWCFLYAASIRAALCLANLQRSVSKVVSVFLRRHLSLWGCAGELCIWYLLLVYSSWLENPLLLSIHLCVLLPRLNPLELSKAISIQGASCSSPSLLGFVSCETRKGAPNTHGTAQLWVFSFQVYQPSSKIGQPTGPTWPTLWYFHIAMKKWQ